MSPRRWRLLSCALAALPGLAAAQATVKPDGQFRYALGAGASFSSGNSDAKSVNLTGEGVRATDTSKWRIGGKALWAKAEGETTAENVALGTQLDHDLTPRWFVFGKADALRDEPANLSSRASLYGGAGRHVVRSDRSTWDVSAGLGYTQDRYVEAAEVDGSVRRSYGRPELLLAEESNHRWTDTTTFRQKLSIYPALEREGQYRGEFDAGLAVAMTRSLSLTAGLTWRYDSDPGEGFERADTLFVTGIAVKID